MCMHHLLHCAIAQINHVLCNIYIQYTGTAQAKRIEDENQTDWLGVVQKWYNLCNRIIQLTL